MSGEFKMAEEYEPIDSNKKSRIDDELLPDLDDAVLRIARMRKNQVSKCKSVARNTVANSVKYYSHCTVQCEPVGEEGLLKSLDVNKYGPIDFSRAQNMSTFSKDLTSCLNEMNDLMKSSQLKTAVDIDRNRKVKQGKFSRLKSSHLIPLYH